MEIVALFAEHGWLLGALAIVWLAFREIAPRTSWTWDDTLLDVVDGIAEQLGVDVDQLAKDGRQKWIRDADQDKVPLETQPRKDV